VTTDESLVASAHHGPQSGSAGIGAGVAVLAVLVREGMDMSDKTDPRLKLFWWMNEWVTNANPPCPRCGTKFVPHRCPELDDGVLVGDDWESDTRMLSRVTREGASLSVQGRISLPVVAIMTGVTWHEVAVRYSRPARRALLRHNSPKRAWV
jgi:hypothetical protein